MIPDVEHFVLEGKNVIVLTVLEYPVKPVSFKNKYLKRVKNSNHLLRLSKVKMGICEKHLDSNHSINDISEDKVERFIKTIEKRNQKGINISSYDFLSKLEILRNKKLTYGAYLLFAKDYCTISDVQVGRFKTDITIIDSVSLNTDLFTEVEEIIGFIKKHLMVEFIITGEPQRQERFDYPLDAIREIVINMVVHRDYRDSSASTIKIYDDRIEFYNPGNLYGGLTIKDLLSGNYNSKTRNKLIARALKKLDGLNVMVRELCVYVKFVATMA